jgi:hypothetical protein
MDTENDIKLPDRLKNSPFEVPNGYFDSLSARVMQKCTNETVQKRSLWQAAKPILSFAAGFLLLFGLSKFLVTVVSDENPNYMSQTQIEEISVMFEDEMSDEMNDEIIAYLVYEQSIPTIFIEDELY